MNTDIIPPHSLESEQSLLGGLLLDPRRFDDVGATLVAGDFYEASHGAIWAAVHALCAANRPVDVVTVHAQMQAAHSADDQTAAYLRALAESVPSSANAKRYAEVIKDRAMQRTLIRASQEVSAIAWGAGEAAEKIDKAAATLAKLEAGTERRQPKMLSELVPSRIDHYLSLEDGSIEPGISTGIYRLNDMLAGGFRPGKVYVLAARPSVGKSSFAQSLGLHVAGAGKRVLMLSQEMPNAEVVDRAIASLGGVPYGSLQSGKFKPGETGALAESTRQISALRFAVDDQPSLKLSDIRSKARWMRGCDLLIVDYVQLCASDEARDNRQAEIEQISRGLKALAKDLQMSVLLLSQLNRKVEERPSKEPLLSDLRDSGSIEQDADVVMFLWPVKEYEDGQRLVGCKLEKNRQGEKGKFGLHFNGSLQRWHVSSEDINQQPQQQAQPRRKVD